MRSRLDEVSLVQRLQQRGVEVLQGEAEIWLALDTSDLRKPEARAMPHLMQVRPLRGKGTVPGYRAVTVLGMGPERRGLLYHHLFSSHEPGFTSEPQMVRQAIRAVGRALVGHRGERIWLLDRGLDDDAIWGTIWQQGERLVCRVQHLERRVEQRGTSGRWRLTSLEEAARRLRPLARVQARMEVRKRGQKRSRRQEVMAEVAACAVRIPYQTNADRDEPAQWARQEVWLVRVRLLETNRSPWWLLTDLPVEDEAAAVHVFRLYCQRWAAEDSYQFVKQCFGWEEVQLLDWQAIRTLVALAWVAAGFLYELGVTLDWPEIHLLARLGAWEGRANRPPGKKALTLGLRRLLDALSLKAVLKDHVETHGDLPPRIRAIIGYELGI